MITVSESERLDELASFGVLDTAPELRFDALAAAAAQVADTAIARVSLIDRDRQWFKARHGSAKAETPRDQSICVQVLLDDAPLVVPDARSDPRFADLPGVRVADGVRFYAGFPLRTRCGAVLGTLCVLDPEPRPEGLDPSQYALMVVLADQVVAQLELGRALAGREATVQQLEAANHRHQVSEERFRVLFDASPLGQVELSPDGLVQRVNIAFAELVGVDDVSELVGRTPAWATVEADREAQRQTLALALSEPGRVLCMERTLLRADGVAVEVAGTVVAVAGPDGRAAVLIGTAVDVTARNRDARRLSELADELAAARDDAVRRGALIETVLDTVGVGIVACDADGRLTLCNRTTRAFHGMPPDHTVDPARWADRCALFGEDGTTPLTPDQVPLLRALTEGAVDDATISIVPTGLPARVVRCDGRAMHDADGRLLGAVIVMTDITEARAVARDLAVQAEFTAVLLETAHTAIWSCDVQGSATYVNTTARRLLGWDDGVELLASGEADRRRGDIRVLGPDGTPLPVERTPLHRALVEGDLRDVEVLVATPGQPHRTLLVSATALHGPDGAVTGAISTGHDVTDLRASEARFRAAFHDGPTPVAVVGRDGLVREVNPALRRLSGRRTGALVGRPLALQVHAQDRARLEQVLQGPGTGAEPLELRLVRADGSLLWCELAATVSTDRDGRDTVLTQLLDVDSRKAQELVLEQAAQVDPLTGLGNRSRLLSRIEALTDVAGKRTVGLLFLDLDAFKAVNDVHGHDAGDAVLVQVAARLLASVRPDDLVIRLGGDEFVVVCPLPSTAAERLLQALAERIERAVAQPVAFRGHHLRVGVSVGAAVATAGESAPELVLAADRAMYQRKAARAG